jgi:hypothetical protein
MASENNVMFKKSPGLESVWLLKPSTSRSHSCDRRQERGHFFEIQREVGFYKSVLFPGLWLDAEALHSAITINLIDFLQKGTGTL